MRTPSQLALSPLLSLSLLLLSGCKTATIQDPEQPEPAGESSARDEAGEAPAPAPEGPALWVAKDADTTVYLFGTVHVLKPDLQWRTPAIDAAFDEASVVYFEADVTSIRAQARMVALMPELGTFDDGRTLSSVLSPEQLDSVRVSVEQVGLAMAMVEPMRPWLVGMTLQSAALMASGYDPQSGVEIVLGKQAEAERKELRYLETAEQQLRIFAGLPEPDQINFLVDTARAQQEEPEALDELIEQWASGDTEGLLASTAEDDAMGSKAVTEALLDERNADWSAQLQQLMADEAGVFFVAVGAAHLVGPTGVPSLLRAAGVEVSGP